MFGREAKDAAAPPWDASFVDVSIRQAEPPDAAAIAAIHAQGIAERRATFETEPPSASELEAEMANPFLVATAAGVVVGFARLVPYSTRRFYPGIGEASLYVDLAARGHGVGRALFEALAAEAEKRGYWKTVGKLFPENTASVALCRALGCREVGVFERHGRMDGRWRDVLLVERLLGPASAKPEH